MVQIWYDWISAQKLGPLQREVTPCAQQPLLHVALVFLLSHHTVIQLRSSHVITGTTLFRHASDQNHELKPHYFKIHFHFIIMFVLPACGSAHYMPGAYRSQKEALDLLEPELLKVVSHHSGPLEEESVLLTELSVQAHKALFFIFHSSNTK